MRLYEEFEINLRILEGLNKGSLEIYRSHVEELVKNLAKKGYLVGKPSLCYLRIPQSIFVIKEFTGPFVTHFSTKIKNDFQAISKALRIEELFT